MESQKAAAVNAAVENAVVGNAAPDELDSDFEDAVDEERVELGIGKIGGTAVRVTIHGLVRAIYPPIKPKLMVNTVVLGDPTSDNHIQVDFWTAWKTKIQHIRLRVGQKVRLDGVDFIELEGKRVDFNKGNIPYEIKMKFQQLKFLASLAQLIRNYQHCQRCRCTP